MINKDQFDLRVVSQLFYPEMVSSGQALTELVEELSNMGLRIKVIASQPTILKESKIVPKVIEYNNIKIVRTWSTRFPKLSFLGKLFNLTSFFLTSSIEVIFKDRKVPLLLVTNPPYMTILGWFNKYINGTKFGVLLFDIMPEQAELLGMIKEKGFIANAWRKMNRLWYKKASYVVVLSEDMLEGAIDNAGLRGTKFENESRNKTKIIHIWSDDRIIKRINKNESSIAHKLNLIDKLVIQYSGNHGRFHDLETLSAITEAMAGNDKVMFQYIGEGSKKILIEEMYKQKQLPNMYVSSYVPKDQLNDSLAMADLGVVAQLPDQERVCYPSKLLGILSSGRAVLAICSKNSEMARMIEENELGFVVDNGDVLSAVKIIESCIDNPDIVKKRGENANEYFKRNFSLKFTAEKYYNLIKMFS
jgi:glycosyltransferase involved in cell wall biosynthesis